MILEVQNSIHQSIRMLDSKLAEVLGRQERIVSMVSTATLSNTGGQQQQQQTQQGQLPSAQVPVRMIIHLRKNSTERV